MRGTAGIVLVVVVGLMLAGCGDGGGSDDGGGKAGSGGETSTYGVRESKALAKLVPAAIRKKGSITVVADATNPPTESIGADGKTIVGLDPDIARALGALLGLEVKLVNAGFDAILPGIAAGRYDLGISSVTDTKERQQTYDFVTYFQVGTAFYYGHGTPAVQTLADLCGKKVAIEKGTSQQVDAQRQSGACVKAGKPKVTVQVFPDQNGANQAVQSGRAQVGMADYPVVAHLVQVSGAQFEQSKRQYGVAPYGIVMRKNLGMQKAAQRAVQELIDDGVYAKILARWKLTGGAIRTSKINGAVS